MAPRGPYALFVGALTLLAFPCAALAENPAALPAGPQPPAGPQLVEHLTPDPAPPLLDDVAAAVRDRLAATGHHGSFVDKLDAAAVAEFYAARNYAPAWVPDGYMTDRAAAVITRIRAANEDGLDPSAFVLPRFDLGEDGKAPPPVTAAADVQLSQAVAAYARQASSGRIDPATFDKKYIDIQRRLPDLIEALRRVAASPDPAQTLAGYNPSNPEFVALRNRLDELQQAKPRMKVPGGTYLKRGVADYRVGFLRKRLKLPTDMESPEVYDDGVADAVKAFQKANRLSADGIVGPKTLAALNADPTEAIPTILVNMEKWRWMPDDLGRLHVRVNVPDFTLEIRRDGDVIHTTRVVVGKPDLPTPIFSDEMEHIVVNPSWNVPASITKNEMLPRALRNPGSLGGYEVRMIKKGRYRVVSPYSVNWSKVDISKVQIRQPPGTGNALGKVKFLFPNEHAVYLHDTPMKSLFKHETRAYSHGCVRVMEPMEFADALLSAEPDLNSAYLKKLYGSDEKTVDLTKKIPIHITYFTAWVDESGHLQTRADLYGHDKRIQDALGRRPESL